MKSLTIMIAFLLLSMPVSTQVPTNIGVRILRHEDSRLYSPELQNLMYDASPAIRSRAALASGRIGSEAAISTLEKLVETDPSIEVRAMAAFALGEIESAKGSDAILKVLGDRETPGLVRARAVEAAGKIAAANSTDGSSKTLGAAILQTLDRHASESNVALLAITAALRSRPEGADRLVARFLSSPDARIRADAANTLSRIRAKNANEMLRKMLRDDRDTIARANAARALGAADDKEAGEVLLDAAVKDSDSRVRVSAIRSLIPLNDITVAERLITRGRELMSAYAPFRKDIEGPDEVLPPEKSELLEIATAIGRLLANSGNEQAWKFLEEFRYADKHYSPEVEIALARVSPEKYLTVSNIGGVHLSRKTRKQTYDWRVANNLFAALGEYSGIPVDGPRKGARSAAEKKVRDFIEAPLREFPKADPASTYPALATAIATLARFKTSDMDAVALRFLSHPDADVRTAVASVLDDLPATKEGVEALSRAFARSLQTDKDSNDAQLAILSAIVRLDKRGSVSSLRLALNSRDQMVRGRAVALLKDSNAWKDVPEAEISELKKLAAAGRDTVWPYDPKGGTKLGQMLNRDADYRRALSRRNGGVKAILTTEKGKFTIDLLPENAPLTVDNFVKLARSGYFNGLTVHRVVPNFVMQDGGPRGDGNGGPGWSIRCEVNMVPYDRGAVGMALSGKDTGGSQWLVTHSPQPHLDGGYTVFGRVAERDMAVVDKIVRGDKILNVRIVRS